MSHLTVLIACHCSVTLNTSSNHITSLVPQTCKFIGFLASASSCRDGLAKTLTAVAPRRGPQGAAASTSLQAWCSRNTESNINSSIIHGYTWIVGYSCLHSSVSSMVPKYVWQEQVSVSSRNLQICKPKTKTACLGPGRPIRAVPGICENPSVLAKLLNFAQTTNVAMEYLPRFPGRSPQRSKDLRELEIL